jgi:hypothetical protein
MKLTEAEYATLLARGTARPGETAHRVSRTEETERDFLARILAVARAQGWTSYHTFDSRHSAPGFPDLILAKPGHRLLCVELKTSKGKPTIEQMQWLSILQQTLTPQVALWRPNDWDSITAILSAARIV